MQSASHDLAIISCQGAHCGFSSCNNTSPHYHCRLCGFGTSQVGNAVAHGRLCSGIEAQKEFSNITSCSDGMYPASSQPFSYYPQVSQATASSSKMITTQQSTMFNFVNPQYGGLYGPQTVFPNPNLVSPSGFTNFSQLDSYWLTQGRLLPTSVIPSVSPSEVGTRNSNSPSCCRGETVQFGLVSPLPGETLKSKEHQSQNWYCTSQSVIREQKYPDSTASSCSISLLFLEQNKEVDECINVDDLCFTGKTKDEMRSSCMEADKKSDDTLSSSSKDSDIVVEESESESSENNDENGQRCVVCFVLPPFSRFTAITEKSPLTISNRTPVLSKLTTILDQPSLNESTICSRCLDLVNVVDSLELKLFGAIEELKKINKQGKENIDIKSPEKEIDESLVCQTCDKTFSSLAYLVKHKQHHTKSFSYCCEYCGKGFTGLQKLENHILLHSKTLRFQCELCGKQFLEKHTLVNHIRQHKGEHRYKCSICDKGFVQKSVFKSHMETHNGRFYVCHHCGRKVKTYSNLMVHIKICSGDLKHICDKCGKKFPLKSLLEKHISFEHKSKFKFTCSSCPKGFWKKSDLVSHSRTHSTDKPFQCSTCNKCYKSKKNLNHHTRLHGSGPNFKCSICGKEFTRADALSDHMNQHSGRKPYQCQTCWKKFANRINYNVHLKRHSEKRGSCCPICKKVIVKGLKEHMQVHSGKKPFSCERCPTVFSFKNSMIKHMKLKHGIFKENKITL